MNERTPKQIKEARQKMGLSQSKFGKLLGYSDSRRVRELESGERNLGPAATILLGLYLGETTIKKLRENVK